MTWVKGEIQMKKKDKENEGRAERLSEAVRAIIEILVGPAIAKSKARRPQYEQAKAKESARFDKRWERELADLRYIRPDI